MSALDAQAGAMRHRSVPAPNGISAARPTLNICSKAASEAPEPELEPSSGSPRKNIGSAAIQFQGLPATVKTWAARPAAPCHEKPQKKYTRAAVAVMHSAVSIAWAALRERPRPVFIRQSPKAASGTRRIIARQNAVPTSESPAAGTGVMIGPLAGQCGSGSRAPAPTLPRPRRRWRKRFSPEEIGAARRRSTRFPIPPAAIENQPVSYGAKALSLALVEHNRSA